jgi:hypothetical protein
MLGPYAREWATDEWTGHHTFGSFTNMEAACDIIGSVVRPWIDETDAFFPPAARLFGFVEYRVDESDKWLAQIRDPWDPLECTFPSFLYR